MDERNRVYRAPFDATASKLQGCGYFLVGQTTVAFVMRERRISTISAAARKAT
jgi:hypothetical protein